MAYIRRLGALIYVIGGLQEHIHRLSHSHTKHYHYGCDINIIEVAILLRDNHHLLFNAILYKLTTVTAHCVSFIYIIAIIVSFSEYDIKVRTKHSESRTTFLFTFFLDFPNYLVVNI